MFTRTITLSKSGIAAAILALSITSPAHADITKCLNADGAIVYSNTADATCSDTVALGVVPDEATVSVTPSGRFKKDAISASDGGQIRETAWAHFTPLALKKSLDKATIHDARQALTDNDRAMASLRQQTLAAND